MGHAYFRKEGQIIVFAQVIARGSAFASSIDGHDSRLLKGRGQKSAGRMGNMMLHEMPFFRMGSRSRKTFTKVMGISICQLSRRVDNEGKKKRVPVGVPFVGLVG